MQNSDEYCFKTLLGIEQYSEIIQEIRTLVLKGLGEADVFMELRLVLRAGSRKGADAVLSPELYVDERELTASTHAALCLFAQGLLVCDKVCTGWNQ